MAAQHVEQGHSTRPNIYWTASEVQRKINSILIKISCKKIYLPELFYCPRNNFRRLELGSTLRESAPVIA